MTEPAMTDRALREPAALDALAYGADGLLTVVAQDAGTGRVLMVAWADREALRLTLTTGDVHFWSRSRGELWRKGGTSGNVLRVRSLHADCDGDTVLALVDPAGPACHTGEPACFGAGAAPRSREEGAAPPGTGGPDGPEAAPGRGHDVPDVLGELWTVIRERVRDRPEASYTTRLLDDENLRLKKLGEETAELILAAARHEPDAVAREAADLVYHALVVLGGAGSSWDDVLEELARRRR